MPFLTSFYWRSFLPPWRKKAKNEKQGPLRVARKEWWTWSGPNTDKVGLESRLEEFLLRDQKPAGWCYRGQRKSPRVWRHLLVPHMLCSCFSAGRKRVHVADGSLGHCCHLPGEVQIPPHFKIQTDLNLRISSTDLNTLEMAQGLAGVIFFLIWWPVHKDLVLEMCWLLNPQTLIEYFLFGNAPGEVLRGM